MSREPLVLKNPSGWFAAGAEVQKAMAKLSDGAFRLFVYLCLNARRDSGVLESNLTQLAKNVKRGQHTVRMYLREMEAAGVCRFSFSYSRLGRGMVEITEAYWPYQKLPQPDSADAVTQYVSEVKKMLQARACIKKLVSAADEILARQWFEQGVSLEHIERAILLGCIRKYVSWRNNQTRTMIGSLQYFVPVVEELQATKPDPEYWNYLRYRLTRMENEWNRNYGKSLAGTTGSEDANGVEL
jgi:hypothetical protein